MTALQVEDLFPRVIDNTMYSDWRSCAHRFFRRHVQGLSSGRTSTHLHYGACFAKSTEKVRRSWLEHGDLSDAVKDGCEEFIRAWGNFEHPEYASTTEYKKTLASGLLAVQDYFREWPLDEDSLEILFHNGEPCIEFSGALPIPGSHHPETGEPIIYCGRFDMIGREGKCNIGLDDKTAGSLGEHWRKQWRLRSQFTGYVWLAGEYGVSIDRFRIRGVSPLKGSTNLDTVDTPRAPWAVNRWLWQLKHDIGIMCKQYLEYKERKQVVYYEKGALLNLVEDDQSPHPFGRNLDHACSDFNGCEFLDLCGSEYPERWLEEFVIDRWNPLERPQ